MDPFFNMFDEPVVLPPRKKAGFSTAITIALIALVIIVAGWWLVDTYDKDRTNNIDAGDVDPYTVVPEGIEDEIDNNGQSDTISVEEAIAAARLEARNDLIAAEARLQSSQNYQEVLLTVEGLEADLERAYGKATGTARADFDALQLELDELENDLRASSAGSLTKLAALIARLGEEVRVDEGEGEYK
ncbi:MAG: hypothetical protein AAB388_02930 [Patescibacteria group bacterium]